MAVTRRGYIYGAFVSSVLCVVLTIVAIASDSWFLNEANVVSGAFYYRLFTFFVTNRLENYLTDDYEILQSKRHTLVSTMYSDDRRDSTVKYGLFSGDFGLFLLTTPSFSPLHMTCVPDMNACAVSCKTVPEARKAEVIALAQGYRPNDACSAVTIVDTSEPLSEPPILSFGIYVSVLLFLFIQLLLATTATVLAIVNALKNPTEPILGLPGCVWTNAASVFVGLIVMLLFGIYWATSGIKNHLAFSYVALGPLTPEAQLGYSYWLLIGALLCSLGNVVLLETRRILLERDPPPPTIKVENHSDGTIFLY